MLATRDEMLARLTELGIEHRTHLHPPVFTVEEAQAHTHHLPGGHCKNLFLKDKKGGIWLVTCRDEARVDLNQLSKRLGAPRFSFGRPELLAEVLGVTPGSVTPLALVNAASGRISVVLDRALLAQESVNCHPLTNDATVTLRSADLLRLLELWGHRSVQIDLEAAAGPA